MTNRPPQIALLVRLFIAGIILLGVGLTTGCGDDDEPTSPDDGRNQIYDSLRFTRNGGGVMASGRDWAICCGSWEAGVADQSTLKILVYDALGQESGFKLFVVVDSVQEDVDYALPTDPTPGAAPVSLFVNDISDPNNTNGVEYSSAQTGSAGTIKVNLISCGSPVVLDVSILATVAPETSGPNVNPITVSGRFICEIYSNPATFGCDFSF